LIRDEYNCTKFRGCRPSMADFCEEQG